MRLVERRFWVFDLDGTLTRKTHDFAALRRRLEMPPKAPILEWVTERPPGHRRELLRRIRGWEVEHAALARPAEGALELLGALQRRGCVCGVLTRNVADIALQTLERCGLMSFFRPQDVIGRELAPPKPSPEGIARLLGAWGGCPGQAVMVGDFRYDIEAGRRAGAAAVWVRGTNPPGEVGSEPGWGADVIVDSLFELMALAGELDPP